MDLIDKIKKILNELELKNPIIDLKFDDQKNVFGYITSDSFSSLEDDKSQFLIWDILRKNLDNEELNKILAIFNETPIDRENRLFGNYTIDVKLSRIWTHTTKDLSKYWVFIDVSKFDKDYKTFFLIINAKYKFQKGLTFIYPNDVIEFMELKQEEIYKELYSNSYNNAVAEIKMDLMNKHDELDKKGVSWKENIYSYVFDNFKLKAAPNKDLFFSNEEIELISNGFANLDGYAVKNLVNQAIEQSKKVNEFKKGINYNR